MYIKELSNEEFNQYLIDNKYNSIYQTVEYLNSMSKQGYETILLGLINNEKIVGATGILIETKGKFKYAYASRGFLIDYNNKELVKNFTEHIRKYLSKLDVVAIKISPMIIKNIYNSQKELLFHNEDYNNIFKYLNQLGFYHLGYNNYFEALKPRFEAVLDISKPYYQTFNNIKKNFRTKIRNAEKSGIKVYRGDINNVEDLYVLTQKKYPRDKFYFADIYNSFSGKGKASLYYTKLNTKDYLIKCQQSYENQENFNINIDNAILLNKSNKDKLINQKLVADKLLNKYERRLVIATNLLKEHPEGIITSSMLIITNGDTVYMYMDGYDKRYQFLNSKHLLLWKLIEKYSLQGYKKFNLGGIINPFSDNQRYNGLNEFKLSFNSYIIEYLGDLELICNNTLYFMYTNSKQLKGILSNNTKKTY